MEYGLLTFCQIMRLSGGNLDDASCAHCFGGCHFGCGDLGEEETGENCGEDGDEDLDVKLRDGGPINASGESRRTPADRELFI